MIAPERRLGLYMSAVVLLAVPSVVLSALASGGPFHHQVAGSQLVVVGAVMLALVIGELFPIPVARGEEAGDEMTVSSMFGLVLVIIAPVPAALIAQALALVIDTAVRRRNWRRLPFNVSQYALSFIAARLVYCSLAGISFRVTPQETDDVHLWAGLGAALVLLVLNNAFVWFAVAFHLRMRVVKIVRQDMGFHVVVAAPLLALAPVIAHAVHWSPWSLAVLLSPIVALHRSGHLAMRREQQALRDPLTQLGNRLLLESAAHRQLGSSARASAILIIDLDHFKEINDTLGHAVGDEVLIAVAARLVGSVRDEDLVTRLGGDEFAILARGVEDADEASALASRVTAALQEPVLAGGVLLDVQASIGVGLAPDHADSFAELMRVADIALYTAKRDRNTHAVYTPDTDVHSLAMLGLQGDLRRALADPDDPQIWLAYQYQLDLATGRLASVEGLVRWTHPALGPLSPEVFIPIAENTGLIDSLTRRVLDTALAQVAQWNADGLDVAVAVNLSARDLANRLLPETVAAALLRHGVAADRLLLEVTESRLMSDPDRAATVVRDLGSVGVQLSIDDFGTGYSSLAYLQRLAVDELKIDRTFITNGLLDPAEATIVRSTIELGHNLGLRVVAEGVEDQHTLELLSAWGCDVAQGYHVGRPAPPAELEQLGRGVRSARVSAYRLPVRSA